MSTISDRSVNEELDQSSFLFKHGTSVSDNERLVWSSFRAGNRKALDYIFEKHIRLLFAYGSKITKDTGLVEDAIQDVFVELWKKREILSDTDNIKLYLLKSLRRRIIRTLSEQSRMHAVIADRQSYEDELEFSSEFHLIQEQSSQEQRQQLKAAITQLSKRQREAIYLKFYEHLTYLEISEMMNLSIKSTYKLIGKAIDSLRTHVSAFLVR
jgi:RNA polymerase sigma factor (sigma-70 family)